MTQDQIKFMDNKSIGYAACGEYIRKFSFERAKDKMSSDNLPNHEITKAHGYWQGWSLRLVDDKDF